VALALTLGMRILLHLSAYDAERSAYDVPPEVTQQGMAEFLSVRQSDVSRALSRMKTDGLVDERTSSVSPCRTGRKQRLRVYFLSQKGRESANGLSERVAQMMVRLPRPDGGEERRVRLGDINQTLGTNLPLVRLLGMISADGTFVPDKAEEASEQAVPPPPDERFVGRSGELRDIMDRLRSGPETVLCVVGIPGVGKTTLAARLLSELKGGRAFYFRVREWASYRRFLQGIRDFLCRFGKKKLAGVLQRSGSPPTEEVSAAVSADLDGLGAVIILDDFHESAGQPELQNFTQELAELLARSEPPSRLLLFSRTSPDFYDRRHVAIGRQIWEYRLGGLDEDSARTLALRTGLRLVDVDRVFKTTKGHPLSIQLLKGLPGGPPETHDARRFLQEEVIGRIPAPERALLQTLSVLRRPEGQDAILSLSEDPLAYDALSSLVSRSLVTVLGGKYEVHEMVKEGAYERMPPATRKIFHMRAAERYSRAGGTDGGVEAVYHYCRAGEADRAAQLLLSLGGELIAEGRLEECRALLDLAEPATSATAAQGLRRLRQDVLSQYGEWDHGYEYLFQCSILMPRAGVKVPYPGRRIRSEREWQSALSDHRRGISVLEKVSDMPGKCELLTSLGWSRLMRGEYREAAEAYKEVLTHFRKEDCYDASTKAGIGMGHLHWLEGRKSEASRAYRSAVKGARRKSDERLKIAVFNYISNLATEPREFPAARTLLDQALALCAPGHRRERAYTMLHLARVRSNLGDNQEALRLYGSALTEFRGIGDTHGIVYTELHLSLHHQDANDAAQANEMVAAALTDASAPELSLVKEMALKLAGKQSSPKPGTGGRRN